MRGVFSLSTAEESIFCPSTHGIDFLRSKQYKGKDFVSYYNYETEILNTTTTHNQFTADACSPFADFSTLKMEAIRSSETSVKAGSSRRHIPEGDILQFT
jgi:hypothetical protein